MPLSKLERRAHRSWLWQRTATLITPSRVHDRAREPRNLWRLLAGNLGVVNPGVHPYLAQVTPIALAHRGGSREAPENSRTAFQHAVDLGYRYIEIDVRATSDHKVMVFHDATLNRVTDRVGRISALPYSEVRKSKISGGDRVMRLEELLAEFPNTNFNIDVKDDHTLEPFIKVIEEQNVGHRACAASFSVRRLKEIRRRLGPTIATSLGPQEIASLMAASRMGPFSWIAKLGISSEADCVQIPVAQSRVPITTQALVDFAHRHGLAVHVWTIDDEVSMDRLLDLGVDGIVTDRPTLLRSVLQRRHSWPDN